MCLRKCRNGARSCRRHHHRKRSCAGRHRAARWPSSTPRPWHVYRGDGQRFSPPSGGCRHDDLEGRRWAQAGGMPGMGDRGSYNAKEAAAGGCERRRGRSAHAFDFWYNRACRGRLKCWLHDVVESRPCNMASTGVGQGAVEAVGVVGGHWPGSAWSQEGVACVHVTAP